VGIKKWCKNDTLGRKNQQMQINQPKGIKPNMTGCTLKSDQNW
jgi:hypothetical protein